MSIINSSFFPHVNTIINNFDQEFFVERKAHQRSQMMFLPLPEVLQNLVNDYVPNNISHWIVSTEILRRKKGAGIDETTEASAKELLKELHIAPLPFISATERLMQYIFTSVMEKASPEAKKSILSELIKTSSKELCLDRLKRAGYVLRCIGMLLALILLVVICLALFPTPFLLPFLIASLKMPSLFLATWTTLVGEIGLIGILVSGVTFIAFYLEQNPPSSFIARQQEKLFQKQMLKAPELWANLFTNPSANRCLSSN